MSSLITGEDTRLKLKILSLPGRPHVLAGAVLNPSITEEIRHILADASEASLVKCINTIDTGGRAVAVFYLDAAGNARIPRFVAGNEDLHSLNPAILTSILFNLAGEEATARRGDDHTPVNAFLREYGRPVSEEVQSADQQKVLDENGEPLFIQYRVYAVPGKEPGDSRIMVIVGDSRDSRGIALSEQKLVHAYREHERNLREHATTDPLTGLLNRRAEEQECRHLVERMVHAKGPQECLSIIQLDLDFFKGINDTYGHDAGDAALLHLRDLLKASVRPEDLVTRLGGDEFRVIMRTDNFGLAAVRAEQIRQRIAENPLMFKGKTIPLSASIGATVYYPERWPPHLNQEQARAAREAEFAARERAYKRADIAAYHSKEAGRDSATFVFPPGDSLPWNTDVSKTLRDAGSDVVAAPAAMASTPLPLGQGTPPPKPLHG